MVKITNISCDNSYICRNYVHASNELDVSNTFKFVKQNTYIYGSRTAALQKYCYKQSNKCNCIQSNTANITDWILLKVDALLTLKVIIFKSSGKRGIFMELKGTEGYDRLQLFTRFTKPLFMNVRISQNFQ